ncbi:hypothetical protein ACN26Y_02790 [Micromonospora sp. WMMD558]|uniref:hypothetical protein n=1 Tax=Micromonospora sp. WMMD558 TaxID=3403462 RepID=UPI003BF4A832
MVLGYPVAMEALAGGRTIGKMLPGLRVVRDDGGPIQCRSAAVWPDLPQPEPPGATTSPLPRSPVPPTIRPASPPR